MHPLLIPDDLRISDHLFKGLGIGQDPNIHHSSWPLHFGSPVLKRRGIPFPIYRQGPKALEAIYNLIDILLRSYGLVKANRYPLTLQQISDLTVSRALTH